MKKLIFVFLLALTAFPQILFSTSTPYNFLRYVSGARSGAMAGNMVSIPNDIEGVLFNPAVIATAEEENSHATFIKHVADINSGLAVYKLPLDKKFGNIALSTAYTSYGSFDYADEYGNLLGGTFGANNFSFAATYADKIDTNFFWGGSIKFIYVGIDDVASTAMAIDAGLMYKFADNRTAMGLSVLHAGYVISDMNGYDSSLPLDVRLGISHELEGLPLLISFSFNRLADEYDDFLGRFEVFSIGGEFNFGENFFVRLGYDNQIRNLSQSTAKKGLNGFTGGVGLKTSYVDVDYGISKYGDAALMHRISLEFDIK